MFEVKKTTTTTKNIGWEICVPVKLKIQVTAFCLINKYRKIVLTISEDKFGWTSVQKTFHH